MRQINLKKTYLFLFLLIFMLQYQYWFAWAGVLEIKKMNNQLLKLTEQTQSLTQANDQQLAILKNLKESNEILEDVARQKLGWIKDDERLVQWRP